VAQAKKAIDAGYNKELHEALSIEAEAFSKVFDTKDQKEGARAYLEKRPPLFRGE
jgi:enoyl-CoA hydratase